MRTLQRGDRPTKLARALQELGRIIKTLYLLNYLNDEAYRTFVLHEPITRGAWRPLRTAERISLRSEE